MIRKLLVMAAVLLGVLAIAPAAHAQYQPGQPGLILTPSTTTPGGAVTAIGFGCARNQQVVLTIEGTVVGTGVSQNDDRGSFEIPFTAPQTPGQYTVVATCGNTVLSSVLTVETACNPAYIGVCIPSNLTNVNCPPTQSDFVVPNNIRLVDPRVDPLDLDRDNDGIGCEAETGALPATGADSFPLIRLGFVLIAAGGLLVLGVRRRRAA